MFSVLNDTFEDDMDSSHADYIELMINVCWRCMQVGPIVAWNQ